MLYALLLALWFGVVSKKDVDFGFGYTGRSTTKYIPDSVLGVAIVTSTVQISQQISSSPFPPNPPNHSPPFRLRFSKNCTAIRLRPPPFGEFADEERCWRMSVVTRESMRVSRSTSLMTGRVRSRISTFAGRIEGKYRWKKIVWRMPKNWVRVW